MDTLKGGLTQGDVGSFKKTKEESSDQKGGIAVGSSHAGSRCTPTEHIDGHEDPGVDPNDQVSRKRLPRQSGDRSHGRRKGVVLLLKA